MTVISYTLILTFLSFLNSHIDLTHMELRCIPGASSSSITHPPPQSSSTQAAAISDRSWRARRGVARVAITSGRCVGMVSVAYAARISVTERSKSAKENECVATSCMIFRWDVLMCRIHTWDWLGVLRFAVQNLPAGYSATQTRCRQ